MNREERTFLESITFAYLVGELEWDPINARRKVETMTDQELEKFLEQPKRSKMERPPWDGLPVLKMADQKGKEKNEKI